ncbi:hypothetical protein DB44_AI00020 [Candidatus Protochlamydia amoebophila]|uniref:Uncharacterized protein n=1 Tax=Candidatus Protochlamydia amoebophila TaxID=362787 RepID=A0A0C1JVL0_9BACT|nr:hypothetical protein DB44_AI00020 [Candidatus Protochlamydia amoebophila]
MKNFSSTLGILVVLNNNINALIRGWITQRLNIFVKQAFQALFLQLFHTLLFNGEAFSMKYPLKKFKKPFKTFAKTTLIPKQLVLATSKFISL